MRENKTSIATLLNLFASEILKNVAVQTHTDWSTYLQPIIEKYEIEFKTLTALNGK